MLLSAAKPSAIIPDCGIRSPCESGLLASIKYSWPGRLTRGTSLMGGRVSWYAEGAVRSGVARSCCPAHAGHDSHHEVATVDVQGRPGDVAGLFRSDEADQVRYLDGSTR